MNASAARQLISYETGVSAAQIAAFREAAEGNLRGCTGHVATAVAEGFAQSESLDALRARARRKSATPAEYVAMVKRNDRAEAAAEAVRELMNRRERALPLTRTEQAIADHIADLYADYVAGCIQHQVDRAEGNA